jgi:hypothetical protein
VGEDGLDGEGVLDGGDNAQPAATAGTSGDIEGEHAVHQRWPGRGARGDGSAGAGLEGVAVRGRAAVADALRAPARTQGEDAVIQEQVHRGQDSLIYDHREDEHDPLWLTRSPSANKAAVLDMSRDWIRRAKSETLGTSHGVTRGALNCVNEYALLPLLPPVAPGAIARRR